MCPKDLSMRLFYKGLPIVNLIKILPLLFFLILMPVLAETSEELIKKGEELAERNIVEKTEEGKNIFRKQ